RAPRETNRRLSTEVEPRRRAMRPIRNSWAIEVLRPRRGRPFARVRPRGSSPAGGTRTAAPTRSRGIPLVDEVLGEKGRQPDALVERTQRGRAAVRRQRLSLELDLHRLEELVWEQDPGRRARRH